MIPALTLTIGCAAAVAALLVFEATGDRRRRAAAKIAASLCFVALPLAGGADLGSRYAALITAGLIFGALGDAALLGHGRRALLRGLVLFLLGHLAYLAAFAPRAELGVTAITTGAAFAAIGALVIAPRAGRLAAPVRAYSAIIGAMVALAIGQPAGWLVPAGAVLFAASDLAVARQRFVTESLANRLFGLPTYYAGQLMIAWSTLGA